MIKKKRKIPFSEIEIHVYQPLNPGRPFLALAGNLPVVFRDTSAMKARKKAKAWIDEQIEAEAKRQANVEKRVKAAAAAKRAKKEAAEKDLS